jgi:POT family proton-dependent oligopeptide transporter
MNQKIPAGTWFGHPSGLFLLFWTEMWERFCFYGLRGILVLTLVAAVEGANPGFGLSRADALNLYGTYTGGVYATAILGGFLADRFLGQRRAVLIGGVVMAVSQFLLFAATPNNLTLFYLGLALMCAGNGLFKPNISTMVGDLYKQGDARRDAAFSIFYMGINIGGLVAPLACGWIAEGSGGDTGFGWRWGYFAAGVGMIISVVSQLTFAQRMLGDVGRVASAARSLASGGNVKVPLTPVERDRLRVVFSLFVFVVAFWLAFEQAGGLMNIYAQDYVERQVGAFLVPATWFQSVNGAFIILLAPVFALLWTKMAAFGRNPAAPVKVAGGLVLVALGFLCLVFGVLGIDGADGKSSMVWLVLAYFFHTLGELCISPVGLSLMTKLAPVRLMSVVMGVWFLMPAIAQKVGGWVGAFSENAGEYASVQQFATSLNVAPNHAGMLAVFAGIGVGLVGFAALLWLISGKLVDWMHGAEQGAAEA